MLRKTRDMALFIYDINKVIINSLIINDFFNYWNFPGKLILNFLNIFLCIFNFLGKLTNLHSKSYVSDIIAKKYIIFRKVWFFQ